MDSINVTNKQNNMTTQEYKNRFNDYYNAVHEGWKACDDDKLMTIKDYGHDFQAKAMKDVVGKIYEGYRNRLLIELGFEASEQEKFKGWNADQVLRINGKVVAIEDDKAQITTGTDNIIMTFIKIIKKCLDTNENIPYFILSSANKVKFDTHFRLYKDIINPKIWGIFLEKFKYVPVTNEGRIKREEYVRGENNPFQMNDNNITNELNFLKQLKNGTI